MVKYIPDFGPGHIKEQVFTATVAGSAGITTVLLPGKRVDCPGNSSIRKNREVYL
jgi:hypothetical protein